MAGAAAPRLSGCLASNWFGQFQDDRVTEVGHELDSELEQVLQAAASV
jgi:hypothetical protein